MSSSFLRIPKTKDIALLAAMHPKEVPEMNHNNSWDIYVFVIAVMILISSCDGSSSDINTAVSNNQSAETSTTADGNPIGAASEVASDSDSLTAGCTVPEDTNYYTAFHGHPVANIQSDVDADGQLDTVELLTEFAYSGGESHDSVDARIQVTFANGGVAVSDVRQIRYLPDGHTIHSLDLHYEVDGFQEIMYDTSFGRDTQNVQNVVIFDDCTFKEASSQTSQQAVYIPLQEVVSDTNRLRRSWGCSRENELLEMKTLNIIETNAIVWTIDTWRLIGTTWEFVESEFDTGPVIPEQLTKTCLLP